MIFQTSRLLVRALQPTDLLPFHEMQSNPKVMQYTGDHAHTFEEDKIDLTRVIDFYKQPNNTFWVWAIERKDNNAFIGTCAIIQDKENGGEIGYRFLEKYWGKGYATETMKQLIEYGFLTMKLQKLYAYVDKANIASVKMLERSQLKFIKEEWNEKDQCTDLYFEAKNSPT